MNASAVVPKPTNGWVGKSVERGSTTLKTRNMFNRARKRS
jgi:hypothetical protein